MRLAGLEPDPFQVQVITTPGNILALAHRQRGKSSIAAAVACAMACEQAGSLTLVVSRSMRQSAELFRKVKRFHTLAQPMALVKDTEHELEYTNGSRIISLPASPETIVGYSSVDLLILEEAARIADPTYYAVRPMLARSGGRILAITTPFGKRGWFYEQWTGEAADAEAMDVLTVERLLADLHFPIEEYSEAGGTAPAAWDTVDTRDYGWTKLFAPITYAPQLSKAYIAHERRSIPDVWFRQEWLVEFVDLGMVVFSFEDLMSMQTTRTAFFDAGGTFVDTEDERLVLPRSGFALGG